MLESIQKLVRPTSRMSVCLQPHVLTFLIAPTIQSRIKARVGTGDNRGFTKCVGRSRSCCKSRRDVPERMRQIHVGPSLVYPAVDAVPHVTIDFTATSDSYPTFVTAQFPPQRGLRLLKPCE